MRAISLFSGVGGFEIGMTRAGVYNIVSPRGRVRRLTPLECDRLMGWPDDWTRWGVDERGVLEELPDSTRYRMTGNGVVSTVAEWIARRIVALDALLVAEEAA